MRKRTQKEKTRTDEKSQCFTRERDWIYIKEEWKEVKSIVEEDMKKNRKVRFKDAYA